jgi:D-glycerate 3-kinase
MLTVLKQFLQRESLPDSYANDAIRYYLPLITRLEKDLAIASQPYLLGISGAQGTGKSTLASLLASLLTGKGYKVVQLSIDDFYLSRARRQVLADNMHPLFATRGVPGTHDIELALNVIRQLQAESLEQPIAIPRFNKATDDPYPESEWQIVTGARDIIILEGWFVGAKPQQGAELKIPLNALESNEDAHGIWRSYVNKQLGGLYQKLFEQLDSLILLKAPSFEQVYHWRCLQERKLAATHPPSSNQLMNTQQIQQFIQHFERLSKHCMESLSTTAYIVFELDEQHRIKTQKNNP